MLPSAAENFRKSKAVQQLQFFHLLIRREENKVYPRKDANQLNSSAELQALFREFDIRYQKYSTRVIATGVASSIFTLTAVLKYYGSFALKSKGTAWCIVMPTLLTSSYMLYSVNSVMEEMEGKIARLLESPELFRLATPRLLGYMFSKVSENKKA